MKRTILIFVLGLLATQLMTACNRSEQTGTTTTTAATNNVTTNTPAATH